MNTNQKKTVKEVHDGVFQLRELLNDLFYELNEDHPKVQEAIEHLDEAIDAMERAS